MFFASQRGPCLFPVRACLGCGSSISRSWWSRYSTAPFGAVPTPSANASETQCDKCFLCAEHAAIRSEGSSRGCPRQMRVPLSAKIEQSGWLADQSLVSRIKSPKLGK